jgi:Kef-type K+ transport system membrane component KefB
MPAVHLTNLLIVVAVGLLAPLALGFFPGVRLPAAVLEIVLGIVVGSSGLGWVKPDLAVSILALVGLAFLLFLSGLELDIGRLRGRILALTAIGFAVSFAIAILLGLGLSAGGLVKSPLFVAIVLVGTSLGVIVPVLKDSGNISSSFGQLVIAAASIADFGSIILLSLFFSGKGSTSTAGALILLGGFGLVVLLVGLAIAGFEHSTSLARAAKASRHDRADPGQGGVRAADRVHGTRRQGGPRDDPRRVCRRRAAVADRPRRDDDPSRVPPQARGRRIRRVHPDLLRHQRSAVRPPRLFASASSVARVPLFLLAIYLARGLPAFVYARLLGRSQSVIAGVLESTSLPFIVAATQIGLGLGVVSRASAAGLVAAGLLSVAISPTLGLVLLRRHQPRAAARREPPSPAMPVITAEDRMLCRVASVAA